MKGCKALCVKQLCSHILISDAQDELTIEDCIIVDRYRSPYVRASYEAPIPVSGCIGHELTARREETHAVNLRSYLNIELAAADSPLQRPLIDLFIKPRSHSQCLYLDLYYNCIIFALRVCINYICRNCNYIAY